MDEFKPCRFYASLGCLSFHITQSGFFNSGCLCSTYYYDGSKQAKRERQSPGQADYQTNVDAKLEIEALAIKLNTLEVEKLDKIIKMFEQIKKDQLK